MFVRRLYGMHEEEVDAGAGGASAPDPTAGGVIVPDPADGEGGVDDVAVGGGSDPPPVQAPQVGKNIIVPTAAMARIKKEERARGERDAMAKLDDAAKQAGFTSMGEAFQAIQALKSGSKRSQATTPARTDDDDEPVAATTATVTTPAPSRRDTKAQQAAERERKLRIQAERKAKEAQSERDAESARFILERAAWNKGIRDTDYAITLLTRHCEGLSEKELESFDEGAYYDGLRKSHPFLFGEVSIPATTGVGGNGTPSPPPADDVTRSTASSGPDVRKMNKAQYEEHLRKKGLTPPSAGT